MKCSIVFSTIFWNFMNLLSTFACPFGWQPVISKGAMISCSNHQKICESLTVSSQCKQARWAASESLVCCVVDVRDTAAASDKLSTRRSTETIVFSTISTTKPTETVITPTIAKLITAQTKQISQTTFSSTTTPIVYNAREETDTPIIKNNRDSNGEGKKTNLLGSFIDDYRSTLVGDNHGDYRSTLVGDNHGDYRSTLVGDNHGDYRSTLVGDNHGDYQRNSFGGDQKPNVFNVGTELLHVGAELVHVGSELLTLNRAKTNEIERNALIENENFHFPLLFPQKNVERHVGDIDEHSRILPSEQVKFVSPSDAQITNLNTHVENLYKHGQMLQANVQSQFIVETSTTTMKNVISHHVNEEILPTIFSTKLVETPINEDLASKTKEFSIDNVDTSILDVNVTKLYILPDGVTQVIPLIEGKKMELLDTKLLHNRAWASVTLLRTPRKNILVDAGWPMDKYLLVDVLWEKMKIKAATDIHHVVITKDGVDTMGAVSDFASADVITPHVYIKKNHAWKHPAVSGRSWYLDDGVVITPTSGVYGREISVLVKNAIGYGRIAIVGRLFMQQNGDVGEFLSVPRGAFARRNKNRKKIVCNVDWVIPIYEKMFKITKSMQKRLGCPRIE